MRAAVALVVLATVAYPFVVWFGMTRFEPRWLALLLLALVAARASVLRDRLWLSAALGAGALVLVGFIANHGLPLKLYPVLVNAMMLCTFLVSLRYPPSAIERLARLREPDLPPEGVQYTRRLTQVWCLFFVLNGSVALYSALAMSDAAWALYNGFIAYLLMGALFAGEWLLRPYLTGRQHG
ncbi:MAG TPA: hypothetical protein VFY12_05070 [Arenimonas sp.]|nr:hypothetical protein [Arenimonas sp.]